ncbi:HET-domain-containing protein [Pleurostoma richardsiae]|uniref:HET-domain-containing protein n=1 Tax=Pleurostoma richardsiae TaxID=41990 RepID=A0AA38RG57_9PEZI|nr:HET-domain-containing protein [Pleurostoma richardsiae]
MRLLYREDTGRIGLTEDLHRDIPRYAILSHTWGDEEVTFHDVKDGTAQQRSGYDKIQFCGDQASRDGLSYFWVDTCCIDKSSSAELTEAINSMFRWYRDAARCYVYLADVSISGPMSSESSLQTKQELMAPPTARATQPAGPSWEPAFRSSRWFTRGWTLQELLAPASVEFFSNDGVRLGDKASLEQRIRDVTRIPTAALRGNALSTFGVSERMAWMEPRDTTREEDKAYALLGIFDVQMSLIYGEGRKHASRRLQEEVDKATKNVFSQNPESKDCLRDLFLTDPFENKNDLKRKKGDRAHEEFPLLERFQI